ncbi:MAG: twin-arginine translocase subunit TatC [Solirubrobacteraceae bacterium]|nr:twin-arginine translocase subunit TatC [Solirubrobacteraceae bacterium]
MPVFRPIGHEDRISIVDHLDELRSRLIVCVVGFVIAFAFTYWQNAEILNIVNQPLVDAQKAGQLNPQNAVDQSARFEKELSQAIKELTPATAATGRALKDIAAEPGVSAEAKAQAAAAAARLAGATEALARASRAAPTDFSRKPLTLGVAEPFVATFTVAAYAALLLTLPLILWQAYAFVLPAFDREERRVVIPLMALVPLLFAAGVLFGYFVALPRAVEFLQNFNSAQFDIQIQARDYYRFVVIFLGLMGLIFQIPVGVLVLTRTGVVDARMLWKRQGYVILGIAVLAAVATPTPDPVTMLVTMVPLVLLYELSIGLAYLFKPKGGTIKTRWENIWDEDEDDEQELLAREAVADEARGAGTGTGTVS